MVNFILFLFIVCVLSLLILIITYFINLPTNDYEKHSAYECGFEPFGDARSFFDIHFYTIGLLFIIFDLEVVFLIPVVIDITNISGYGYISILLFLLIVIIGFYYEWAIGLLDWVPQKTLYYNTSGIGLLIVVTDYFNLEIFFFILHAADWVFSILTIFLFCVLLIINRLHNLVYKVINLALLSLLVVGIWVTFTELLFIYIIYVFAFIGAVIMLFLSVILMLPVNVITSSYQSNSIFLLFTVFFQTELYLNTVLFTYLGWFLVFISLSVTHYILYNVYIVLWHVFYPIIINIFIKQKVSISLPWNNQIILFKDSINLLYSTFKALCGFSIPPAVFNAYTTNPQNYSAIPQLSIIGAYWYDFLYYLYIHVEARMYNDTDNIRQMYKYTNPVWGKLFMIFETRNTIARSMKFIHWPLPDTFSLCIPYIPVKFKYSIFNLLPYASNILLCRYRYGNTQKIVYINRLLFIFNCIVFLIVTILINIWVFINYYLVEHIYLICQLLSVLFIFLMALPFTYSSVYTETYIMFSPDSHIFMSSLQAIKHILYEENIIFLFISALGLLIALIGSAIFTRRFKI